MDTGKLLAEIWGKPYMEVLPDFVKKRGYAYASTTQNDILIAGFNPSFRAEDRPGAMQYDVKRVLYDTRHDNYWSPIRRMLSDANIDLRDKTGYLDIFYFREQKQTALKREILSTPEGVRFVADQLNVTQHILEEVARPKLLVVKNKEAAAYFGILHEQHGWVWMGYEVRPVDALNCGKLYRITGLIDSECRIAPEIRTSNLVNTLVLLVPHINQYVARDKRPTPKLLNDLLDAY